MNITKSKRALSVIIILQLLLSFVIPVSATQNNTQTWTGWLIDWDCIGASPLKHTKGCLKMSECQASGLGILVYDAAITDNSYSWIPFDAESQAAAVNLINNIPENVTNNVTIRVTGTLKENIPASSEKVPETDAAKVTSTKQGIHVESIELNAIEGGAASTAPPAPSGEPSASLPPHGEESPKSFSDIADYPWAKDAIETLASRGVINGKDASNFAPGEKITRADFIKLLVATLNLKAEIKDNFDDVSKTDYYYEAVGIAKALNITGGAGDNSFKPKEAITRQEVLTLIARALKLVGHLEITGTSHELSQFSDKSDVADYAVDAVASLVKEGIVKGDGNTINPKNNTTRAETAVLLYRIFKTVKQ